MDKMIPIDAILFPTDERLPYIVPLMTSSASSFSPQGQSSQHPQPATARAVHPEMYMDFIAEGVGSWRSHVSFYIPLASSACIHLHPAFHLPHSKLFLIFIVTNFACPRTGVNDDPALPHFVLAFASRFA